MTLISADTDPRYVSASDGSARPASEEVLRDADTAMYQAKRKGGASHQIIDLREQHLADQRANLERDLRGAAFRGELRAEYQPVIAARGARINVSAHQLMTAGFAEMVASVLATTKTDPESITLDVTESVFVQDSARALVVLRELKRLGVGLALDDFGTGYSSLTYLNRFPLDIVKVDRSFVASLGHDTATDTIVEAVIDLAHKLQMTVVAEGVETLEQYQQLESLGCDACQGYYFAHPMSAGDFNNVMGNAAPKRNADRSSRNTVV